MNAENGFGATSEVSGSPSLWEWRTGTHVLELKPGAVSVWLVDLDAGLSPGDVDTAEPGPELGLLDDVEKARAARFVRARDRRRFAHCRGALRMILGSLLGRSPQSLRFRARGQGKPELDLATSGVSADDVRAALQFNVSHSSELAMIAVCLGPELGVDIERVRRIAEADRIVASFFSAAEQAEFATIPDHVKDLAFFRGWTRKEAVLKGLGIGLAGLAAHYETGFGTEELPAHFISATPSPRVREWQLWEAAPGAGFVATVAVPVLRSDRDASAQPGGPGSVVACPGEDAVH